MTQTVRIISGRETGQLGTIDGKLDERRKTLGKDAKIKVTMHRPPPWNVHHIRIKHLEIEIKPQGELF